jgi:hypothetical protein
MGGLVIGGWTGGSGASPVSSIGVETSVGKTRVGRGLIGKLHEATNPRMTIELTILNNFTDGLGYRENAQG